MNTTKSSSNGHGSQNADARKQKLGAGRYVAHGVTIIRNDPPRRTGHHLVTTWRNETTNEMLGYTLREALELCALRQQPHRLTP